MTEVNETVVLLILLIIKIFLFSLDFFLSNSTTLWQYIFQYLSLHTHPLKTFL